jgi:hypothetical protein
MARVSPFHYRFETRKLPNERVYHNDDDCSLAKRIAQWEREDGTSNHRQCKECAKLNLVSPRRWI